MKRDKLAISAARKLTPAGEAALRYTVSRTSRIIREGGKLTRVDTGRLCWALRVLAALSARGGEQDA